MGITIYEPAPTPTDEAVRERAVLASGALGARSDGVLQAIVEECRQALRTRMAAVSILYQDWQYLIAASGITLRTGRRRTSLCGHAIMTPRQVFCVADVREDSRFAANPVLIDGQQVRFYAGSPLVVDGYLALGTLCVLDSVPRADFGAYEQMRLKQFAERALDRLVELRPR